MNPDLIQRTLEVWQPRTTRTLTEEDAREIVHNAVGFFGSLLKWEQEKASSTMSKIITINRAPVLTLWATVVSRRLGFKRDEALTLGKAVAGLNAQSKGRRLGIFKPHEDKTTKARTKKHGEQFWVEVVGRPVPAKNTKDGVRAVTGEKAIDPKGVQRYLESKFGDDLSAVETALVKLAKAYKPKDLAADAFSLYEQFRPRIPEGKKGWGAKGELDLGLVAKLTKA